MTQESQDVHLLIEEGRRQEEELEKRARDGIIKYKDGVTRPHVLPVSLTRPTNSNTEKTTQWALNTFNSWRHSRETDNNKIPDLKESSKEELNFWLSQFVRECKQKDGRDYKHQNLYAMMCGLARHIKKDRPRFNILDDPGMADLKVNLQEVMKGLQVRQAQVCTVPGSKLSRGQWNSLWEQGLLGEADPQSLFHSVYFLFVTVTGLTSAVQLRSLTTHNIVVTSDPESNNIVTTYYPNDDNKGCRSDRAAIRCMESDRNNPRSFGRLLELYLSKLPSDCLELWLRPSWKNDKSSDKTRVWYSGQPVGQNLLRTTVKTVCQMANFQGNYSSHSLDRDLLNWENYNIEHLATTATSRDIPHPKQSVELGCTGIKREYVEETIPRVTINTHLNSSPPNSTSKRLRSSQPLDEKIMPNSDCALPSENLSLPLLSFGPSSNADSNARVVTFTPRVVTTPSQSYASVYPFVDVVSTPRDVITTSHDVITTPQINFPRDFTQSQHANTVDPLAGGQDVNDRKNVTNSNQERKMNADRNHDQSRSNIISNDDLRNVNVDIPEHVDKCMGLFKDCTIQNVTINIYLSKTRENGH